VTLVKKRALMFQYAAHLSYANAELPDQWRRMRIRCESAGNTLYVRAQPVRVRLERPKWEF